MILKVKSIYLPELQAIDVYMKEHFTNNYVIAGSFPLALFLETKEYNDIDIFINTSLSPTEVYRRLGHEVRGSLRITKHALNISKFRTPPSISKKLQVIPQDYGKDFNAKSVIDRFDLSVSAVALYKDEDDDWAFLVHPDVYGFKLAGITPGFSIQEPKFSSLARTFKYAKKFDMHPSKLFRNFTTTLETLRDKHAIQVPKRKLLGSLESISYENSTYSEEDFISALRQTYRTTAQPFGTYATFFDQEVYTGINFDGANRIIIRGEND